MSADFEKDVIDRLARIETEQQYIRKEIGDIQALEVRVKQLEDAAGERRGRLGLLSALWGVIGAFIGSLAVLFIGRMF